MSSQREKSILGVIGGSGLYDIDGLQNKRWISFDSPFGKPSDELLVGELDGMELVFLPRHGRGHKIPPSEINYRANIDVLKRAGVTDIISVSAVGSLKENLSPGMFIIVDQFIDRTFARNKSFFGKGLVAHVSMAHPVCSRSGKLIEKAANAAGINATKGGTYLAMEGPQFSTKAESELYRSWNCDIIGMTNMPEAKLAREAEMCYASVAMVTDFDCWHPGHDDVTVDAIIKVLHSNADKAKSLIKYLVPLLRDDKQASACSCRRSLDSAIITPPDSRDSSMVEQLDAVAGRVLKDKS
jgi:5'-methylthioadenosine phosphorylase